MADKPCCEREIHTEEREGEQAASTSGERITLLQVSSMAPFASLKKQAETLFRLICCERKTLFRLKKQAEKDRL